LLIFVYTIPNSSPPLHVSYAKTDPFIFLVHHTHSFRPGEITGFPAHPHRYVALTSLSPLQFTSNSKPNNYNSGFETVTYIVDGGFDHADSRGNKGRYGAGDVQFMTAGTIALIRASFLLLLLTLPLHGLLVLYILGKGVLHSEMFVTKNTKPSTFDGWQLWLNLPSKLKLCDPAYQMIWANEMPTAKVPVDGQVRVLFSKHFVLTNFTTISSDLVRLRK
jgi:redox-sensitive bicupin YhaK (pirin superfamily)